ncbi:di-heme oxidoredictase family protein [Falsirhodobacter algicola]|uniref:C-type cytochrome n=1 Tax=Falsirhodobacter algicola TaxID=2692330 RepID=A0A8J8SKB7_9RHOB|nr:di-heme oxidoredictase family protein [Falsirhodobacter algicola]QUS35278.1 c-type cytochrome [Falsirhodobacter algicola]
MCKEILLATIALSPVTPALAAAPDLPAWLVDARADAPFARAMPAADDAAIDRRMLGRSFFSIPWVAAPAATSARDGLGPLFNANTCASCHEDNGSAATIGPEGQPLRPLLFKLARPDLHAARMETVDPEVPDHARIVDPAYGAQIAINAVGRIRPEARPALETEERTFRYPDGSEVALQRLIPRLEGLNYGPLAPDTVIYLRQPPALAGLGLLDAVPDAEILDWADPADRDGDGISGRANRMPDGRLGRYGWKASEPTLQAQIANAAALDMGLTNPLYPNELCRPDQADCRAAKRGRPSPQGPLDLPGDRLAAIEDYLSGFRAPDAPADARGQALFDGAGCTACHRPAMTTEDGRTFHPMSDYLLHDMGPGLADGVREQDAGPSEFRTAPLMGLGARLRAGHRFLHDARARTSEEAILWHGGEAAHARAAFTNLTAVDRAAILDYLESL